MNRLAAVALAASSTLAAAQQPIVLRRIAPAEAVSRETLAGVFGIRELPGGGVFVNDPVSRRLLLFDASLSRVSVVADTTAGAPSPYGKRASGIIAYLGDTTLLIDPAARAFVAYDAAGKVVSVLSPPRANDVAAMVAPAFGETRTDPRGRLVYRSSVPVAMKPPEAGKPFVLPPIPDSAPVLRADFDRRGVDTLAWLRIPRIKASTTTLENGGMKLSAMIDPLPVIDDWTMLPDGTVAIVRGQDYHIDWIGADGARRSTPKMPFAWRRLSDQEKLAIVDSARRQAERQFALGGPAASGADMHASNGAAVPAHSMTILKIDALDGGPAPKLAPGTGQTLSAPEVIPASELPDYMPSLPRSGLMMSDRDGNVWVLPSTSAESGAGLVYDIVNRNGELFERVRLPAGRSLAGFGAHGAIYFASHDAAGIHLERARIEP